MSLSSLNLSARANVGTVMPVLHFETRVPLIAPDNTPVTISLLGRDAAPVVELDREIRNEMVEEASKGLKYSAAQAELRDAKRLAVGTTGWNGIPKGWLVNLTEEDLAKMSPEDLAALDDPAPFSEANAITLYTNPGMSWLRDAVKEWFDNRGKLLKASQKS